MSDLEDGRLPPHDTEAEANVLGFLMWAATPEALARVSDAIGPGSYFRAEHQVIAGVITDLADRGEAPGATAVADELHKRGLLARYGGYPFLYDLIARRTVSPEHDARIVAERAGRRRVIADAKRAEAMAWNPAVDLADLEAAVRKIADSPRAGGQARAAALELTEFLDADEPEYDWLVPGLLERRDRVILTGGEGKGKSTLLRQFGVQVASGVHPFGGDPFPRRRVLLADVENSREQTRRKLRPLAIALKADYSPVPGLYVENRPEGLDLSRPDDREWLTGHVRDTRPELLITGPLYKLMGGDPTSEEVARQVSAYFDWLRGEFEMAVMIEAHSPHASNGGKRPIRPYGASLWLRWPEFGIHLSPEGQIQHWRGQRDERAWPAALQRGGLLPWTVVTRERDLLWARIVELCAEAGDQLSQRDLAELTGKAQMTVQRAIAEHAAEWAALAAEPPNHRPESPI